MRKMLSNVRHRNNIPSDLHKSFDRYRLFKDLRREPLDQVVTSSYSKLAESLPNSEKHWTLSVTLFGVGVRWVSCRGGPLESQAFRTLLGILG